METQGVQDWFRRRLEIADGLVENHNAVFDAEILLCCAISALAAIAWSGDRKDRRRYIEFLVRFVRSDPQVTLISVPILTQRLESYPSRIQEGKVLRREFFPSESGRIVNYREIDKAEDEIRALLPRLPVSMIREASYASILYSDLRTGLIHEYGLYGNLAGQPMSIERGIPHYANMLTGAPPNMTTVKKLFLPYPYIRTVAEEAVHASCDYWGSVSGWEISAPTRWWIFG